MGAYASGFWYSMGHARLYGGFVILLENVDTGLGTIIHIFGIGLFMGRSGSGLDSTLT